MAPPVRLPLPFGTYPVSQITPSLSGTLPFRRTTAEGCASDRNPSATFQVNESGKPSWRRWDNETQSPKWLGKSVSRGQTRISAPVNPWATGWVTGQRWVPALTPSPFGWMRCTRWPRSGGTGHHAAAPGPLVFRRVRCGARRLS